MGVIPNKYLSTNLNRLSAGPGSLLKANNVRNDGGVIRSRRGQDLLQPQDEWGISTISGYQSFRCRKLFYYNGNVWGYFQDDLALNADAIGYFDRNIGTVGQWILSSFQDYSGTVTGFNVDDDKIQPQVQQSNNRLLLATQAGVFASPKLETDQLLGTTLSSIQTQMRPAGCPAALPFRTIGVSDTTGTYAANWLQSTAAVSYRHVWKYTDANGAVSYGAVSDSSRLTNTAGTSRAALMTIAVPLQIYGAADISRFSCQIYRTLSTLPSINGIAVDPGDQMFLVNQIRPTAAQVSLGYMGFTDIIDPAALQGPLYTNQTQQGAASSRIRPPICRTMADFSGAAWFGNITDRWQLPFQLGGVVDPAAAAPRGLAQNDILILGDRCFQFKATVLIAGNQSILDATNGYTNQFARIKYTINNLSKIYNDDFTRQYYNLQTLSGPDDICGQMNLQQVSNAAIPDGQTPYIGLYRQGGWPANMADNPSPITPTPLVTDSKGKGYKILRVKSAGSSAQIQFTLNAAPDFVAGDTVNLARPMHFYDATLADKGTTGNLCYYTPGQYVVTSVVGSVVKLTGVVHTPAAAIDQQIGVNSGIWQHATVWTNLGAMHCVLDSATGLKSSACGHKKTSQNRVMYSPYYEPESAPALNYFDIGSSDKSITKIIRLNKSLFVFKDDGLFRITGIYPDFVLQQFDPDIILLGPDLVTTMGGSLYCLTSKGVYEVSQSGSNRISYQIQNQIQSIVWRNKNNARRFGFAVGNQQDHSVSFWLPSVVQTLSGLGIYTRPNIAFVYDGYGWTKRTDQANGACCGYKNKTSTQRNYLLYTMKDKGNGWLTQQRKSMSGVDFCDQKILVTGINAPSTTVLNYDVNTNAAGTISYSDIPVGSVIALIGDLATKAVVISNTVGVGAQGQFTLQGSSAAQFVGLCQVYFPIALQWQYVINDPDDIQNRKHFSQIGVVFQQPYFTKADIGFASDVSPATQWLTSNLVGFDHLISDPSTWPILQDDQTLSDKTIRSLVATSKARCSQLRVSVRHCRAMQFISVYGYFVKYNTGGKNIERSNGQ